MLPMCAVISVVYSATRSDDWNVIAHESVRRFVTFVLATGVLGVALMILSNYIQPL
jgi:hypothetical protein